MVFHDEKCVFVLLMNYMVYTTTIICLHFNSLSNLSVILACSNCKAQSLSSDRVAVSRMMASISSSSGGRA